MRTLINWPGLGGRLVRLPLAQGDNSFALVADVDQDEFAFHTEDTAFDDLVDGHLAATPIDFVGGGSLQPLRQIPLATLLHLSQGHESGYG